MRAAVVRNRSSSTGQVGRAVAACALLAALQLGGGGCALFEDDKVEQPEGAIKVLSANPITGSLSFMGPGLEKSMTLAVREINAAGGVLGRPLQLVTADTHSDETAGLSEAQFYYDEFPDIVGVAGGSPDAVSKALLQRVARRTIDPRTWIPMVSPASTSPEFVGLVDQSQLFVRTVCNSKLEGRILAEKARDKGYRRGVAIGISDTNTREIFETFQQRFFDFAQDDPDYAVRFYPYAAPTVAAINSAFGQAFETAPQFVLLLAYGNDGKVALNEWARRYKDTPLLLSDALMSDPFMSSLDPTTLTALEEGVVNGVFPGGGTAGAGAAIFTQAFCREYPQDCRCEEGSSCDDGEGLQPSIFAANAYDAIYVLALGLTIAADAAPASIVRGPLWNVGRITDGILAGANQDRPEDVPIGPGEWPRALEVIQAGQGVDYTGASSSSLELDPNGDPRNCDFSFWSVSGGRPVFVNSDGEKQSVSVSL